MQKKNPSGTETKGGSCCPNCGSERSRVSWRRSDGPTNRRRRVCLNCRCPFYTRELTEQRYKKLVETEEFTDRALARAATGGAAG